MKKSIFLVTIVTLLIATLLVGCQFLGGDNDSGNDNVNDNNNNNDNSGNDNVQGECTEHSLNGNCVCTKCNQTFHALYNCVCTKCNQSFHETTDWIVENEATCTQEGTKSKKCSICNTTLESISIPKTNHSLNENCVCGSCKASLHELDVNCKCSGCKKTFHARDGLCKHGDYVYFGLYPQTIKEDNVTITDTTNEQGYYLGSDNEWYAKITAKPKETGYAFSNGEKIYSNSTYYFKIEPIKWRILNENENKAVVICDSIIMNEWYDASSCNYQESDIRAWLNNDFINTAFTEEQQQRIFTTTVDNSVESTGYESNTHACENTQDKIYLPSYVDVTNADYGFDADNLTKDDARKLFTTDYVRAMGVDVDSDGYASWWLRSPHNKGTEYVRYVSHVGQTLNYYTVSYFGYGIVPIMTIQL